MVFWHFFDTLIDLEPYFSLSLGASYRSFRLDNEKNLLVLMDNHALKVFKVEDLNLNQPKCLVIEGKNFDCFELVRAGLKGLEKVIIYSLDDVDAALMEDQFDYVPKY